MAMKNLQLTILKYRHLIIEIKISTTKTKETKLYI